MPRQLLSGGAYIPSCLLDRARYTQPDQAVARAGTMATTVLVISAIGKFTTKFPGLCTILAMAVVRPLRSVKIKFVLFQI